MNQGIQCLVHKQKYYTILMMASRPSTSIRDNRPIRQDIKTTLSQIRRPLTANNDSLRQIIQVIEKTLSQGAQITLNKTKQVLPKTKRTSLDFIQYKIPLPKQKHRKELYVPRYRTQFTINNSMQVQKNINSINLNKKQTPSPDSTNFIPYMKQEATIFNEILYTQRRQRPPMKRMTRRLKTVKQNEKESMSGASNGQIDKWQNGPSLHLSNLLDEYSH